MFALEHELENRMQDFTIIKNPNPNESLWRENFTK